MSCQEAYSLEELVTRIEATHHVTTRGLLSAIRGQLDRVSAVASPPDRERVEALRRAFVYFRDDLIAHLSGEERVVFPYVVALEQALDRRAPLPRAAFRSISSPVQVMKNEQQNARDAIERLDAAIVAGRPTVTGEPWRALDDLIQLLRVDLAVHVRIEQEVLFPQAVEVERKLLLRQLEGIDADGSNVEMTHSRRLGRKARAP